MRNIILLLIFCNASLFSVAQHYAELTESSPYSYNGFEYGYNITNETSKEVKGEDYDRFEITLYVTNKSGCDKLIPFRRTGVSSSNNDDLKIAEFNCINATGKRLTAKKGTVKASPWYLNVKLPDASVKEKYRMTNAQAGYIIGKEQSETSHLVVLVPKGERPKVNCRIINLPDIQ